MSCRKVDGREMMCPHVSDITKVSNMTCAAAQRVHRSYWGWTGAGQVDLRLWRCRSVGGRYTLTQRCTNVNDRSKWVQFSHGA